MKAFVTLLLLPVLAWGQAPPPNPCNLPGAVAPYVDFTTTPVYTCAPAPSGDGTAPQVRVNAAGVVVWWYCKGPAGTWGLTTRAASASVLTPAYLGALSLDIAAATQAVSPTVALNALTQARITTPLSDPSLLPVICPWTADMAALRPAPDQSANLSRVPPSQFILDGTGATWMIRAADSVVTRNSLPTSQKALQIFYKGGAVYIQSPTGGYWWKWLGGGAWQRLTTTEP